MGEGDLIEEYMKVRKMGLRDYHRAVSEGRYPYLTALDDILPEVNQLSEYPVGLAEIPLSMIIGTKSAGRTQAFADTFMPLLEWNTEFANKWYHLYNSQLEEGIHDAIKVYEYMHRFYVQEGNKRVSVSRYVEAYGITADITRIIPKQSDDPETKLYFDFLEFFNCAPIYEVEITTEGGYQKLAQVLGETLDHPWPEQLVTKLRGSYQTFEQVYLSKAKDKVSIPVGDAFLTYVTVYGLESLTGIEKSTLAARIDKTWGEMFLQTKGEGVSLVKTPEEALQDEGSGMTFFQALFGKNYTRSNPLHVAFCYEKSPESSPWIYGHELGRNYVETKFDGVVKTHVYDGCTTDDKLKGCIDDAVAQGCDVIFTVSPKQIEETMRSALHYPKVKFLNCSINLSHSHVRTYYGRMFEAKAILGALAATMAEEHKLGYIADYPIYGTVAEINAFAIGAAMIDPKIQVHLLWNSVEGTNPKEYMKEHHVQVIMGQDFIKPDAPSRAFGLFHVQPDESIVNLGAPVWNWGKYYELILRSVIEGRWENVREDQAMNYWWGMSAGVIDVILSDHLPYYSYKLVDCLKEAMVRGALGPYDGELRSQDGVIREADDPHHFRSDEIIQMDWLNDNIIGSLPKFEELTKAAQETVLVSGIIKK